MKIYLAGPIDDCNHEEIHEWRENIKDCVNSTDQKVEFIDPSQSPYTGKANKGTEIVQWDKSAIHRADIVVVNYWKLGTGTAMEIMYCYMINKPTIVIAPQPRSPWITAHASVLVSTLSDAIHTVEDWMAEGIPYLVKGDPVNHPEHYTAGGIEVADFLEAKNLDKDFYLGNVIKYVSRGNFKGKLIEDLQKAKWYLDRKIAQLTAKETDK